MLKLYIRLPFVYWPIFNKAQWLQNARKIRYTPDAKCYDVIVSKMWKIFFFSKNSHIMNNLKGLSLLIIAKRGFGGSILGDSFSCLHVM